MSDQYHIGAKYYDAFYASKSDLVDAAFYCELAANVDGPILEIGCGTGRLLLPIARQGTKITGVEYSDSMLDVLRSKLNCESSEIQNLVTLHQGDARSFVLAERFQLVTMPFRVM